MGHMSHLMLGAPRLCSAPVQRVSSLLVSRRLSIVAPRNAALSDASAAGASSAAPNSGDGVGDVIELGPVTHVKVKAADFVKSSVTIEQCPAPKLPEFAVIGRSNVGKSSLINMLTGKKALALVSKTPGKTKCINHFLINNSWYLVDLPGYGYAKTSKTNRLEWASFTQEYFLNRETLVNVLLLVDSSVPPQKIDLEVVNWLGDSEVPFSIVFTKTDKRKKRAPAPDENMAAFKEKMLEVWEALPACLPCCAVKGDGRVEILHHIAQYRTFFERNTAQKHR